MIRLLAVGIVLAGLVLQGCSRDEPPAEQEIVSVEPRRVDFHDDFVVRVAMQKREGLVVSIFKAGAGETAPPVTAQPLRAVGRS